MFSVPNFLVREKDETEYISFRLHELVTRYRDPPKMSYILPSGSNVLIGFRVIILRLFSFSAAQAECRMRWSIRMKN
jgi:hypothetical protein